MLFLDENKILFYTVFCKPTLLVPRYLNYFARKLILFLYLTLTTGNTWLHCTELTIGESLFMFLTIRASSGEIQTCITNIYVFYIYFCRIVILFSFLIGKKFFFIFEKRIISGIFFFFITTFSVSRCSSRF